MTPLSAHLYDYSLKGIVAHAGTADSGHYYSFIRERGEREVAGLSSTVKALARCGPLQPMAAESITFHSISPLDICFYHLFVSCSA